MIINKGNKILTCLAVVAIEFFKSFISCSQPSRVYKTFNNPFKNSPEGKIQGCIEGWKSLIGFRYAGIACYILVYKSVISDNLSKQEEVFLPYLLGIFPYCRAEYCCA